MVYVSDSLRLKGEGKYISKRWFDIAFQNATKTMDPESVVEHVINGAGLEVKHEPTVISRQGDMR